jgi:hypothetical protein
MSANPRATNTLNAPVTSASSSIPVPENEDGIPLEAIAQRAFEIYLASGRRDGQDVEHWLEAERQLRKDPKYR